MSCTILIFDCPNFCTGFKRFCRGVLIIEMAEYFLIVRKWLKIVIYFQSSPGRAIVRRWFKPTIIVRTARTLVLRLPLFLGLNQ